MTQKTSGEPKADGDLSVGNENMLSGEHQQKTSKRDSIKNIWGDRTLF